MAYNSLTSSLIEVGKALKKEIFSTLKNNQDDLNTRLGSVEALNQKFELFNFVIHNGASAASFTGLSTIEVLSDITVTQAEVSIFDITGTSLSGTLEIDVQVAPLVDGNDFTNSASIFTTKPSIDFSTASSYDESTNQVLDVANQDISSGQIARLDISSLPTGDVISKFRVKIIGEAQ